VLVFIAGAADTYVHWLVAASAFSLIVFFALLEWWIGTVRNTGAVSRGRAQVTSAWPLVAAAVIVWLVLVYVTFSNVIYAVGYPDMKSGTISMIWITTLAAYALFLVVFVLVGLVAHFFFDAWSRFSFELVIDGFYLVYVAIIVGFTLGFAISNCVAAAT
jgi:hypothetical protein